MVSLTAETVWNKFNPCEITRK